MIQCVILASGFSKRMGSNKLLLDLGGTPLLGWVIKAAKQAKVGNVHVVYRDDAVKNYVLTCAVNVIENKDSFLGQSMAIVKAVQSVQGPEGYLFLNGDQPFIGVDSIRRVVDALQPDQEMIVSASWSGMRSPPVAFGGPMRPYLLSLTGDVGGRQLIESKKYVTQYIEFEQEYEAWDADCPETYKRICDKLKQIQTMG